LTFEYVDLISTCSNVRSNVQGRERESEREKERERERGSNVDI